MLTSAFRVRWCATDGVCWRSSLAYANEIQRETDATGDSTGSLGVSVGRGSVSPQGTPARGKRLTGVHPLSDQETTMSVPRRQAIEVAVQLIFARSEKAADGCRLWTGGDVSRDKPTV